MPPGTQPRRPFRDGAARLFNYRFDKGNGLDGHSFGNLFLTALTEITGSAERAIDEMGRLLNIKGCVLPVTLANADLCARLRGRVGDHRRDEH